MKALYFTTRNQLIDSTVMKRTIACSFLIVMLFAITATSHAQLRDDLFQSSQYTGNVVKERPQEAGDWSNLFNMTMDHSYSMTFSSFGGQYQNLNAYTNTMHFYFSNRMTGRVDISLLHSPFGNSYLNNGQNNSNVDLIIRNAELNYQISDKSSIQLQFRQVPAHYGYYGPARFGNPFYQDSFYR